MGLLMFILLLAAGSLDDGHITKYLVDQVAVFDQSGAPITRMAAAELPRTPPIVGINPKNQLGVKLRDGSVVYVRRGDVAYDGASSGICVSVASKQASEGTLAAGDSGARRGAGEGQHRCLP